MKKKKLYEVAEKILDAIPDDRALSDDRVYQTLRVNGQDLTTKEFAQWQSVVEMHGLPH